LLFVFCFNIQFLFYFIFLSLFLFVKRMILQQTLFLAVALTSCRLATAQTGDEIAFDFFDYATTLPLNGAHFDGGKGFVSNWVVPNSVDCSIRAFNGNPNLVALGNSSMIGNSNDNDDPCAIIRRVADTDLAENASATSVERFVSVVFQRGTGETMCSLFIGERVDQFRNLERNAETIKVNGGAAEPYVGFHGYINGGTLKHAMSVNKNNMQRTEISLTDQNASPVLVVRLVLQPSSNNALVSYNFFMVPPSGSVQLSASSLSSPGVSVQFNTPWGIAIGAGSCFVAQVRIGTTFASVTRNTTMSTSSTVSTTTRPTTVTRSPPTPPPPTPVTTPSPPTPPTTQSPPTPTTTTTTSSTQSRTTTTAFSTAPTSVGTNSTSSNAADKMVDEGSIPIATIAGAAVSGAAVLLLLIALIVFLVFRARSRQKTEARSSTAAGAAAGDGATEMAMARESKASMSTDSTYGDLRLASQYSAVGLPDAGSTGVGHYSPMAMTN
jgi:hypothetical protein